MQVYELLSVYLQNLLKPHNENAVSGTATSHCSLGFIFYIEMKQSKKEISVFSLGLDDPISSMFATCDYASGEELAWIESHKKTDWEPMK